MFQIKTPESDILEPQLEWCSFFEYLVLFSTYCSTRFLRYSKESVKLVVSQNFFREKSTRNHQVKLWVFH